MTVVTLILLAIFITILKATQRNNERMSVGMLQQALTIKFSPHNNISLPSETTPPFPSNGNLMNMRMSVLIIEVDTDGIVSTITNQLHFIENTDIKPISKLVLDGEGETGIVPEYKLRYLRRNTSNGFHIALADISIEQEILNTQIKNVLLIGSVAMFAFFLLSIFLSRWAVRPIEIAWERQKQFIANASHELKTPLTVILSNADMLKTDKSFEDEKNIRRMEHIHAEAMRMKKLVEDMLTLVKSDNMETQSIHSLVDFSYILKSAVLMYEPIIFDDGKKLSYKIETGLSVMGDAQELQQTIYILLDNALKYSPTEGSINIELYRLEGKTLLLKVKSDGMPIPVNELENIFLRFYRRDEARSEHDSFGLGLSIAQNIINWHNGKIWAESSEKLGNIFYVILSLV